MFNARYFAPRYFCSRYFVNLGQEAEWVLIHATVDTTSEWTDTSVSNGVSYQYYVVAVNTLGGTSAASAVTGILTPSDPAPPPVDPPDPEPGPPAENNDLLSAGHHPFLSVWPPVPESTTTITEGDQAHLAWMFSGVDVQAPPVDISIGATIEDNCVCTPGSGATMDNADGSATSGAVIESAEPSTSLDGSEIEDDEQ